jgi:hypothetical protein
MVTVPAKLNFVRIDPDLELNRIRPEEAVQCSAKSREDQHDEDHYGAWKSTRPSNVEHTDKLYRRGCKNRV